MVMNKKVILVLTENFIDCFGLCLEIHDKIIFCFIIIFVVYG